MHTVVFISQAFQNPKKRIHFIFMANLNKNNNMGNQLKLKNVMATKGVLKFLPFTKVSDDAVKRMSRDRISFHKIILFAHDLIAMSFTFLLFGAWVTGMRLGLIIDENQIGIIFIFSFAVLFFFHTYKLYSYHVIFSIKEHLKNLFAAMGWASFSIVISMAPYFLPQIFKMNFLWLMLYAVAFVLLLLSRVLWEQILNVLIAIGIAFFAVGIIVILYGDNVPVFMSNWFIIPISSGGAFTILVISRLFLVHVVFNRLMRRHFRKQVVVIGSDEKAKMMIDHVVKRNAPFWISGFIGSNDDKKIIEGQVPKIYLGKLKDLPEITAQRKTQDIIITDEGIDKESLIFLLDYCTSAGITAWFSPKLLPIIDMKLYIDSFCGIPTIRLCSQQNSWVFNTLKHSLDALIALPVFLALLPVFIAIGMAIKFNSKGPVFYRAHAIGKSAKEFTMFKFRSMKADDDNEIHKNYVTKLIKGDINYEENSNQVFKVVDDPRVTSVGKLLRKYSLDELPQIINVLRGEMSLVGPRPCLPYEYDLYKEWHKKRFSVRPGITGIWQVSGRSEVTFEDMVLLDIYYIYNRSLLMDMNIIWETFFSVLGKKGAY
jgi:exopolysaccharide biosynthesis polyprenyl glycosylphosphotransferase